MKRIVALAVVGLVVVVGTGFFAYQLSTNRGPTLIVTDGSITGVIEGDLTNVSSLNPLYRNFTGTTYANQSGEPSSAWTLSIWTVTAYENANGGFLRIWVVVQVSGRIAANLHLTSLTLTSNQTGLPVDAIYSFPANQTGTNVTYDPNQHLAVFGNGSGQAQVLPDCGGAVGGYCTLAYGTALEADEYIHPNTFIGLQAAVNGQFTPAVSVGILLQIVTVAAG